MWDRFRAGADAGVGVGVDVGAGAGAGASASANATAAAAAPWPGDHVDTSRTLGRQQQQPQFSYASSNANGSWQPRSLAIAQRQQHQHQQQQRYPRSASGDNYGGRGANAAYGGYSGYSDYSGHQYSIKGGPPPARPPRDFELPPPVQPPVRQQTFPQQPPGPRNVHQRQGELREPRQVRESAGRPTSSVYSQHSFSYSQPSNLDPCPSNQRERVNVHRYQPGSVDDVSPPSSPEVPAHWNAPNHDISPIDEEDDIAFPRSRPNMSTLSDLPSQQRAASRQPDAPSSNPRSNIPMMRRERRQKRDAETAGRLRTVSSQEALRGPPPRGQSLRPVDNKDGSRQPSPVPHSSKAMDSKVRLQQSTEDHSQNPGNSHGRPRGEKAGQPQASPFGHEHGLGISTPSAEGRTLPNPPKSAPTAFKQHPMSDTDPAATAFMSNRPGWRGASGRAAIVEPVKDNPTVAPLRLPPRNNKRVSPLLPDGTSPSPSPSPSPSLNLSTNAQGGGGRSGDGNGGSDLAMSSPPISPETQLKEQDQQPQQQRIGALAGVGRKGGVASSMANTLRRFMPSSQRQPSSGQTAGSSSGSGSGNATPQGYPSPPLSSSPTQFGRGSAAANAASAVANEPIFDVHADGTPRQVSLQQQTLSAQPSPTSSHLPIRRKRVGSGPLTGQLGTGAGANHQPKDSFASSVYSQRTETNFDHPQHPSQEAGPGPTINTTNLPGAGNADSPYVQPPSRFSITTYATSAYTSTPRESLEQFDRYHYNDADAPPLPTPPKDVALPFNNNFKGDSVMDRSRPKLRSKTNWDDNDDEPVKISLSKPWMSTAGANSAGVNVQSSPPKTRREAAQAPRELPSKKEDADKNHLNIRTAGESTNAHRAPSIVSVDKALPAAPPEMTAFSDNDRVAYINAQLQSLGNRRININHSIKQMTELMPRDNLMAAPEVMRKREQEKLKIQELENELADVQREEHDLGMKLHRAYKRLDRHADYEPTTLWVRRATG